MKYALAALIAAGILLVSRAALCEEGGLLSPYGVGVSAGAGVTGFVDSDMRAATDPGGAWEVRGAAGTLANADRNTSSFNQEDDLFTLSLAVGVDLRIDRIILDARAVMRPTFDNELLPDSAEPGNPTRLDSLGFLVRAGVEL